MVTHEKVKENRLRQMAKRQRLRASKSPRRDPRVYDYGRWVVTDTNGRRVMGGPEFDQSIDDVERFLRGATK